MTSRAQAAPRAAAAARAAATAASGGLARRDRRAPGRAAARSCPLLHAPARSCIHGAFSSSLPPPHALPLLPGRIHHCFLLLLLLDGLVRTAHTHPRPLRLPRSLLWRCRAVARSYAGAAGGPCASGALPPFLPRSPQRIGQGAGRRGAPRAGLAACGWASDEGWVGRRIARVRDGPEGVNNIKFFFGVSERDLGDREAMSDASSYSAIILKCAR
jgi:hypothetical protein